MIRDRLSSYLSPLTYKLESETHCECKLLRRRCCHTTTVEELRILSVELLVGIEQAQVGGLELHRGVVQAELRYYYLRQVVGERHLLQADKSSIGYARCRVVVSVISVAQLRVVVVLAARCYYRYVGKLLISRLNPAVLEFLWHRREVAVGCRECRVEANLVAE